MKILSLSSSVAGPACAIAVSIKKHFYNNNIETNFFDFLEVSLESIIKIINIKNNNLNIEDLLKNNLNIIVNNDGNNSVFFNNFDKLISHHDLNINYNNEDFDNLIKKYVRRYNRFLNTIINEDKIFFLRFGNESKELIIDFIKSIKNINSNLKIIFIHLFFDSNNKNNNYELENYHYINFYNTIDYNKIYSEDLFYKTLEFDWFVVFEIINNYEKINFY